MNQSAGTRSEIFENHYGVGVENQNFASNIKKLNIADKARSRACQGRYASAGGFPALAPGGLEHGLRSTPYLAASTMFHPSKKHAETLFHMEQATDDTVQNI